MEEPGMRFSDEFAPRLNDVNKCLNKMKMQCNHRSPVELICGPPETGKTKIVSVLLSAPCRMKSRTLSCAPTNIAITEVAARVLKLVKEDKKSYSVADDQFCSLGGILIGNKQSKRDSKLILRLKKYLMNLVANMTRNIVRVRSQLQKLQTQLQTPREQ